MHRYPPRPVNVRLTLEELENYFESCVGLVKNFVDRNKAADWIYRKHGAEIGNYGELTSKIWMLLFNGR